MLGDRLVTTAARPRLRAAGAAGVLMAALLLAVPPAVAQTSRYAGRPVAEVLRALASSGLRVIFSTDLVPATLIVKGEPTASDPTEIARQVLAPHGLTLEPGPRGSVLVVRRESGRKPSAPPPPRREPAPARPPDPDPIRIEERVDVAERISETKPRGGGYAVEPRTIGDLPGGLENVLHALATLPGVAATNDGDGKLAVRGAGPEHNMIVVDGIQIYNPYRLGQFTASFLNPATAAAVTIDSSGLEARHGGRLSSVTSIETRDGTRDRRLALSGSLGLTSGDLLFEGRLPGTDSGAWWATARGTYYRALVNRFGDDAVPGFGDVQLKVSARPTDRTRLTLFGLAGREVANEPDRVGVVGNLGSADGEAPTVPGVQYRGLNLLAVMNLWWTPSERLATTTTVSVYDHEAHDDDASLTFVGVPAFERDVQVTDFTGRHRVMFMPATGHLFDAGVQLQRVSSSWRMANAKPDEFARGLGPSTWGEFVDYTRGPVDTRLARTQIGTWLQYRMPVSGSWSLEPGGRLDWNSYTGESTWQPRVRLSGRAGGTSLWGGWAEQAQTPGLESLQGFEYFHLTADNGRTLRNERSRQVTVGAERSLGAGFRVHAEAYRRRFDRLLVQRLETEPEREARLAGYELPPDLPSDTIILERRPTAAPESTGRGDASGVELMLQHKSTRVTAMLAYTFSKATREMYGYRFPFDFDRPHAVNAMAAVRPVRWLELSALWRQASGFPATPITPDVSFFHLVGADGSVDPIARPIRRADGTLARGIDPSVRRLRSRNTERLNGYSRTDIRAAYSRSRYWEVYAELLNVFDQPNFVQQIEVPPSIAPGGATENTTYEYYGRLPSFGLRVRF